MRHLRAIAARCLPLASELLIVFLTADILWQLLCGRPPFSMAGFLLSGVLMAAANHAFLRRPRLFWQVLLLNVCLCAVWIPLLSLTLERTYPPLLVLQLPLFLFPLCRGYHWGVASVSIREIRSAGEYMCLYGLFYLTVASFLPLLLARVPILLAVLLLDLLAVVGMRTSGRNTIRAGSSLSRLPALLGLAALARWIWRNRLRVRSLEEAPEEDVVRTALRRPGLLARLRQRLRIRVYLARYAGTPRAALLQLERWGAGHHCRRQRQETPREYLTRLAEGPLGLLLDPPLRLRYDTLMGDVDRSLYGALPPQLSREQVRELLAAIRRGKAAA